VSSSDDVLSGGGHNSALVGEFSNDTLTNAGYDSTFTFSSVDEGIDMSTGFSVIDDAMYMSQMGFIGGLTTETSSLESQFVNGLVDVITFPDFVST
jgi:Ca2+-binding RTX toxin-like protein